MHNTLTRDERDYHLQCLGRVKLFNIYGEFTFPVFLNYDTHDIYKHVRTA